MLAQFTNLSTAKNFSNKTFKASAIILGDNNRYWVVTLGRMETLLSQGYELAA